MRVPDPACLLVLSNASKEGAVHNNWRPTRCRVLLRGKGVGSTSPCPTISEVKTGTRGEKRTRIYFAF
jgi:hypothetical protein